jgi:flagellar hook-length control protein FliK
MMVSDGGGSMRFDMPTPWGKVDLAVQVDGNNVQIKLMTESAQARDALQADLSRLRDNLASQNLRLHQVDFGLLNGQSLTQQFDQRNFDSRNFREEILDFRTDALRNAQRATTTATRAIDRVSGVTQIGHANGHIQVRV